MISQKSNKVHAMNTFNGRVSDISRRSPSAQRARSGSGGGRRGSKGSLNGSGVIAGIELFERSKKSWIANRFSKRDCIRYIAAKKKPNDTRELCQCGKLKEEHGPNVYHMPDDTQEVWTAEKCTTQSPTDAYGEIDFLGGHNKRAPYVRVSYDTNAKLILKLFLERWRLEAPNLIISVTGGAKSFVLKPKLKEVFRKGLIKAAKTTGAWIITGGTNTGVMKHVGEAVKDQQLVGSGENKVNVIGIATWGIVDGKDSLTAKTGENGLYPAFYRMDDMDGSGGALLDSNHSHFILVDNGTEGKYGVEIDLRSKIEEAIMKLKTESRTKAGSIGVPVVLLVLEGGPNTVKTMCELIKKKIPAVVVDGSGRAANVVAFAYSHTIKKTKENGDVVSVIDPAYEKEVKDKVFEVFSFLGEQGVNDLYEMMVQVLEDEKMITIYRLEDGDIAQDIDLVILKALLKANRSSPLAQLNLALAWNRIDVAKSELFTEDKSWTTEMLSSPMLTALLDDKPEFVRLFLQSGLSMREFLSLDVLCQLYNGIPNNATVKPLLIKEVQKRQGQNVIDMQAVGKEVEDLMGDAFHSHYLREPAYFSRTPRPTTAHGISFKLKKKHSTPEILMHHQMGRSERLPTPHLDVFIWAVLCNRRDMARMLWESSREPIASALMASKLLKGMADIARKDDTITDISSDLREHADTFEELATGVLDECYEENEPFAQTLLVKELNNFGKLTCLDLAAFADDQNFIAHTACQVLLTRLWMGAMAMNTPWFKVFVCMIFPPLIVPVIYFVPDEQEIRKVAQQKLEPGAEGKKAVSDTEYLPPAYNNANTVVEEDEEAAAGIDSEDFAIQDYIPDLHQDDSVEVVMRQTELNFCQRIVSFYEAPFSKFVGNVVSYLAFIVLYAYMILMDFQPFDTKEDPKLGHISHVEIVLYFWILTILMEELRQIVAQQPKAISDKIALYFSDSWNVLDVLSLLAFITAVVLRFFDETFEAARIILALDIVLFVVRSLQIFSVNRLLGPKLVMIRKMMEDLKQFIIILMVFIISFGIAQQAVLFPGPQFARGKNFWTVIRGIVDWPYWQMYGELFLDEIQGDKISETGPVNGIGTKVAPFLLAIYMLFTNILLLNLLIAIFNYTFERVQEDSDKVWKFQRYDLVSEYHGRPVAAPPLIFVGHIIIFIRWIWQMCRCGNPPSSGSAMKIQLTDFEQEQLMNWEFAAAESYCYSRMAEVAEQMDERVRTVSERVDTITQKLDRVMDSVQDQTCDSGASDDNVAALGGNVEARLSRLEAQLTGTAESVNTILALLQKGQVNVPQADVAPGVVAEPKLLHHKARSSLYPQSTVRRFEVPDDKVAWEVSFPSYKPVSYTDKFVLKEPLWPWADPDVTNVPIQARPKFEFNKLDAPYRVNRASHMGTYKIADGLPLNPMGRTGIVGRGLLGRYGPNHAADPIVTRWKRNSAGVLMDNGKKVLEFVAIQRRDNNQWAIPGGMVEPGQAISQALKAEFGEEAMAKLSVSKEEREKITKQLNQLFQHGVEVYKGYVDDPRNTDNSWMETIAMNYHDDTGDVFSAFKLQAGDDAQAVRWQRVSGNIPLYASHVSILEKVAKMRDAAF